MPRSRSRSRCTDGAGSLAGACLLVTVLLTAAATALLLTAVATDHWEHVAWNHDLIRESNVSGDEGNASWRIDWLLDGQVVRLSRRQDLLRSTYMADNGAVFLVPVHGGVWNLCPSLDDEQLHLLKRVGYAHSNCINYLSLGDLRLDWQQRMQNLSIACTLVCLIILGSSVLLGVFGVLTNQITAVLVTGVMYLLAATFATFTLLLIHFKRHDRPNGHLFSACSPLIDGVTAGMDRPRMSPPPALWAELVTARVVTTGWSLHVGWGGVAVCTLASIGWMYLSKLLRQCPW